MSKPKRHAKRAKRRDSGCAGENSGDGTKKGWEVRPLQNVSTINYGYAESASMEPVEPRFLRVTDIQNDRVDWNSVYGDARTHEAITSIGYGIINATLRELDGPSPSNA